MTHIPAYSVPRAVFNSSAVVSQVFLSRIQSFYVDPADINIPQFTRDLFRAMVAATTTTDATNASSLASGTPASPLYYLTESAADSGDVLLVSVCQVDYVELDAGWNRLYNMSVCRRDDVGPACTSKSGSCKVNAVNYCNCSSSWQSYPPTRLANLSSIPNYPEPPPTPAPTAAGNSTPGNHSSSPTTAAAAAAASQRRNSPLDTTASATLVVQIQFSFLLQNAPAFRPKTTDDILGNYTLLHRTLQTVMFGNYTDLHLAYFLLPGSGNTSNNTFFPTPPPVPVIRITTSSSFLPVLAILVFAVLAGGIGCYKLYKYIRWRMTVGRFRVAPRDVDGGESGDHREIEKDMDPNDVDDVEMVAKLGDGAWVKNGATASSASAALFAIPTTTTAPSAGEISAIFDPLAEHANRELQQQLAHSNNNINKTGGAKSGGGTSSEISEGSSSGVGKHHDESDGTQSNAVVRALHHHRSKHHVKGKGGKIDKLQLSQGIAACTRTLTAAQEEASGVAEKERLVNEKKNASAMQALLGADVVIVGTAPRSKLSQPLSPSHRVATAPPDSPPTTVVKRAIDPPSSAASATRSNPMDALNNVSKAMAPLAVKAAAAAAPNDVATKVVDDQAFSDAEGGDEEEEEEEEGNYWDEEDEESGEREGDDLR
jgi:hypothetical protein